MNNLEIYNNVREVPKEALTSIQAGRLKGKFDINPMWRIKMLTEQFGPCGIGWKYVITEKRLEQSSNSEISAFVDIDLFIKVDGKWSEAIPGTGGSSFVSKESKGLYTSDECFKMALTDSISVACKALGIGADVYWNKDVTKYTSEDKKLSQAQISRLFAIAKNKGYDSASVKKSIMKDYKKTIIEDLTKKEYDEICSKLEELPDKLKGVN